LLFLRMDNGCKDDRFHSSAHFVEIVSTIYLFSWTGYSFWMELKAMHI
jgi:hypothetical protein